jgi:hypothetical protein
VAIPGNPQPSGNPQAPGKPKHPVKIALLVLALLLSVGLLVLGSPGRWLTFGSILIAALSVGGLVKIFLSESLTPAQKNAFGAALGCATLLFGYLAIPGVRSSDSDSPLSLTRTGNDPFSWDLVPNNICEGFCRQQFTAQIVAARKEAECGMGVQKFWRYCESYYQFGSSRRHG